MAWIESHQNLEKNGKLLMLANKLAINRYQAIGHLHALWWWALDNAEDGNVGRFGEDVLSQAAGWVEFVEGPDGDNHSGKHNNFIPALIECGFLDRTKDGLFIHSWADYTRTYFKIVREGEAQREKWRVQKKAQRQVDSECPPQCPQDVHPMSANVHPPTIPDHTLPNQRLKELPPAKQPRAAKPVDIVDKSGDNPKPKRRKEGATPFWAEVVAHIDTTWKAKKKVPYHFTGHIFKELKGLCRTYQPWGVMALWDDFLATGNDWVRSTGYSFTAFVHSVDKLVDNYAWKVDAQKYEKILLAKEVVVPKAEEVNVSALVNSAVSAIVSKAP